MTTTTAITTTTTTTTTAAAAAADSANIMAFHVDFDRYFWDYTRAPCSSKYLKMLSGIKSEKSGRGLLEGTV
jgi:hypothetical protein